MVISLIEHFDFDKVMIAIRSDIVVEMGIVIGVDIDLVAVNYFHMVQFLLLVDR